MPGQPITRPGDRIFVGVEMPDQLKRVVAVLVSSSREIVELPVRVNAEGALVAKSPIAGTVGYSVPTGLPGDRDHPAIEPSMLGGG